MSINSIDAYDALELDVDVQEEEIKKAFKRLSLQHHPDKVQAAGNVKDLSGEKFKELTLARDILVTEDRKKIYDTFGIDLGEERPEMEVWTIGLSTVLSPMGIFALKTVLSRVALWLIAFRWVGNIVLFGGVATAVLFWLDLNVLTSRGVLMRAPEYFPVLLNIGIVNVVIILHWIWPLLAEAIAVFYLASEVIGPAVAVESWKVAGVVGLVSLLPAWLLRGWWWWVLGLEVLLMIITLAALTVAAGIMRLWIDGVQTQRGEKIRQWRMAMRKERKRLQDEVSELKRKLQDAPEQKGADATARRKT